MLSDHVFDHEFAPQQTARIVGDGAQPLLLRELLFAYGCIGRNARIARRCFAQCGSRIASCLLGIVGRGLFV